MSKNNIKEIKQASMKRFTAEQKIQIVLEGLRGEVSIAEICCREGIANVTYYKWSKDFLDAGNQRDNHKKACSARLSFLFVISPRTF